MGDVVLLTGATGFVGTEVANRLLRRDDTEIVALVQAAADEKATRAAERAWWYQPELRAALGDRIHAVAGDLTHPRLGLTRPENVFVADATLFPKALGNPPILTIIALAKRLSKICAGTFAHGAPALVPERR